MTVFSQEVPNFPLSFSETSQNNQSGKFGGFINKIHRGRQWCVGGGGGGPFNLPFPLDVRGLKFFVLVASWSPLKGPMGPAPQKKKR